MATKQRKPIEPPAPPPTKVFKQRRVDEFATEVEEGFVQVDGLDQLIPLEAYLVNLKEEKLELEKLKLRRRELSLEINAYINDYLSGTKFESLPFQEKCRCLSYSFGLLYLEEAPYYVASKYLSEAYHWTHFVRAVYAVKQKGEPTEEKQAVSRVCEVAPSDHILLRERVRLLEHLFSLVEGELPKREPRASTPKVNFLETLKAVKEEVSSLRGEVDALREEVMKLKGGRSDVQRKR